MEIRNKYIQQHYKLINKILVLINREIKIIRIIRGMKRIHSVDIMSDGSMSINAIADNIIVRYEIEDMEKKEIMQFIESGIYIVLGAIMMLLSLFLLGHYALVVEIGYIKSLIVFGYYFIVSLFFRALGRYHIEEHDNTTTENNK